MFGRRLLGCFVWDFHAKFRGTGSVPSTNASYSPVPFAQFARIVFTMSM